MLDLSLNDDLSVKAGDLILSEPLLNDPNFRRTVVWVCEHSEASGTFGFVVNKPSLLQMSDLLSEWDMESEVFYGGPVGQDKLFFIHRIEDLPEKIKVKDGFFWGGDIEKLLQKRKFNLIGDKDFRFILGYSGWSAGQLEQEIKSDSWIVVRDFDFNLIFNCSPEILWETILNQLGGKYKLFAKFPLDPKYN
jgi:putative transcriptional regulator